MQASPSAEGLLVRLESSYHQVEELAAEGKLRQPVAICLMANICSAAFTMLASFQVCTAFHHALTLEV